MMDDFIKRRLASQSRNSRSMMEAEVAQNQASTNVVEAINLVAEANANLASMYGQIELDKKERMQLL